MKLGIEAATTGIKPPKAFCSSMFATIGLPDPLAEKKHGKIQVANPSPTQRRMF